MHLNFWIPGPLPEDETSVNTDAITAATRAQSFRQKAKDPQVEVQESWNKQAHAQSARDLNVPFLTYINDRIAPDKIMKKNNFTLFVSKISKLDARKKWIISSVSPKGELIIDDGAKKALKNGKSLLAAGIKKVNGKFSKGNHIKILDKSYKECARGLCSFSSNEVVKILGHQSKEIEKILGYTTKSEVVHKDDMVEI